MSQSPSTTLQPTQVARPVAAELHELHDNRQKTLEMRAQGLTLKQIGQSLGISHQAVSKLLQRTPKAPAALVQLDRAVATLQELSASTRASLANVFELGAVRAHRRMTQVAESDDDAQAKAVLETAKLATDGAAKVHGWDQQAPGGPVLVGLSERFSEQVIDVQDVAHKQDGEAG